MIGVGAISGIYLKNITNVFKEVELVGVCDLIPERAEKGVQTVKEYIEAGAKAPVPKIYKDMYEAFNDPEVEVVLNLTRPYEHYGVTKAAASMCSPKSRLRRTWRKATSLSPSLKKRAF